MKTKTNKIEREKQRRRERKAKEQLRKDLLGMLENQREASRQRTPWAVMTPTNFTAPEWPPVPRER